MKRDARIWSLGEMPRLDGRTAVVTGPTSGLGTATALELARAGARVVLAGRSEEKVAATTAEILTEVPDADLTGLQIDLASLESVRTAAAAPLGPIHLLINNAGVMATPAQRTVDGLDLQMASNHFGHYLLTSLLWPQLVAAGERGEDARVVSVSSLMHTMAKKPPLADPFTAPRRYSRWGTYAHTKLANLLFTYELDRRATAAPVRALAAHPGISATHLLSYGQTGRSSGGLASVLNGAISLTAQPAGQGALPTLMAATADLLGGTFCGPSGFQQFRGLPRPVGSSSLARDPEVQRRFWQLSEQTVEASWPN